MKKYSWTVVFLLQAAISIAQWLPLQVEYCDRYNHVLFVNDKTGFIDGPGKILKTSNAGLTWEPVYSDPDVSIVDISFVNDQVGFISAEREGKSFITKTVNGGKTWSERSLNMDAGKMLFTTPTMGHMASAHGMVFSTNDGGKMWMHSGEHGNVSTGDFCFLDRNTGYFAGWYNGSIIKTTDGGESWQSLHVTGDFLDIYFPSKTIGYTAGLFGGITKTEDEGITWRALETGLPKEVNLFSIHCTDNNTCFAVGDNGTLINTTDGGEHWEIQQTGTLQKLNAVTCKGGNCYIVGDSGIVLKASDIITRIDETQELKEGFVLYPNPSAGDVMIQVNKLPAEQAYLLIHDVQGRLIDKRMITKERMILNGKELGAGVYSCSLYINEERKETKKLIIYE